MDPGIVLLLGLLVLVYLNVAGRRRAQRRRLEMDQQLVPGAEVVTTSGLHGSVDEVDDDGTVLLEIAPGWVTRWEKAAVARIIDPATDDPQTTAETDDTTRAEGDEETTPSPYPAEPSHPGEPAPSAQLTTEPGARPLPGTAPTDRA